jgi:hypothetical protein
MVLKVGRPNDLATCEEATKAWVGDGIDAMATFELLGR